MTNTNLLKSKMIVSGDEHFVQSLQQTLNCSRTTASKKLNGELPFSQTDIILLTEKYNFSGEDIKNIFVGIDSGGRKNETIPTSATSS